MKALAAKKTLAELAARINDLAKTAFDSRLAFCLAMNEARERVPQETGMTFVTWGAKYLRKPDGMPWSKWTLYSYASYGADPTRLDHVRRGISAHGKEARSALRLLRNTAQADQVNAMMTAWEASDRKARAQFLHLIGAEIRRQA
jgi:hypothetical protein